MINLTLMFLSFYIFLCFQYYTVFHFQNTLLEVMYQNASSKNRNEIKNIKTKVEKKIKLHIVLFWPVFEIYFFIKRKK